MPVPIEQILADPEFGALSLEDRRALLSRIDPNLATQPEQLDRLLAQVQPYDIGDAPGTNDQSLGVPTLEATLGQEPEQKRPPGVPKERVQGFAFGPGAVPTNEETPRVNKAVMQGFGQAGPNLVNAIPFVPDMKMPEALTPEPGLEGPAKMGRLAAAGLVGMTPGGSGAVGGALAGGAAEGSPLHAAAGAAGGFVLDKVLRVAASLVNPLYRSSLAQEVPDSLQKVGRLAKKLGRPEATIAEAEAAGTQGQMERVAEIAKQLNAKARASEEALGASMASDTAATLRGQSVAPTLDAQLTAAAEKGTRAARAGAEKHASSLEDELMDALREARSKADAVPNPPSHGTTTGTRPGPSGEPPSGTGASGRPTPKPPPKTEGSGTGAKPGGSTTSTEFRPSPRTGTGGAKAEITEKAKKVVEGEKAATSAKRANEKRFNEKKTAAQEKGVNLDKLDDAAREKVLEGLVEIQTAAGKRDMKTVRATIERLNKTYNLKLDLQDLLGKGKK